MSAKYVDSKSMPGWKCLVYADGGHGPCYPPGAALPIPPPAIDKNEWERRHHKKKKHEDNRREGGGGDDVITPPTPIPPIDARLLQVLLESGSVFGRFIAAAYLYRADGDFSTSAMIFATAGRSFVIDEENFSVVTNYINENWIPGKNSYINDNFLFFLLDFLLYVLTMWFRGYRPGDMVMPWVYGAVGAFIISVLFTIAMSVPIVGTILKPIIQPIMNFGLTVGRTQGAHGILM